MKVSLDDIIKGKLVRPLRLLVYGVEGIGKTTFAGDTPRAIFLCSESGTEQLDTHRFPTAKTYSEVLDYIRFLGTERHDYQTLVIDTLDWVEPLIWNHICRRDKKADIEDYGWAKGYVVAMTEWRELCVYLSALRANGMHVVIVAHSQVKTFKNPEGDDFDRYEMALHKFPSALWKQWCDDVLFANYDVLAYKDSARATSKPKGVSLGKRILHTQRSAAFDAKNRHCLPKELELSWPAYWEAVNKAYTQTPEEIRTRIWQKLPGLPRDAADKATEFVGANSENASKLLALEARIDEIIAGSAPKEEEKQS